VAESGVISDHFVKISGLEIWGENGDARLPLHIKGKGRDVTVQTPSKLMGVTSVELSADGELGIFSGDFEGGDDGGAWIFSTKDGKLLSNKASECEWAGFGPDRKQALTVHNGRLTFWNLVPDAKGRLSFEATGRTLTQTGMTGAVVSDDGGRVATRSSAGDVIVWDGNGKTLQRLELDPLWKGVDLDSTAADDFYKPALDTKRRLLATAYGRAFVLWDADSGKPLSDPIFCSAKIRSLDFSSSDSTNLLATLQDGSVLSWDHAGLSGALAQPDVNALRQLALAVADDHWVEEAPKLAADLHPSSKVVAKLLEHFSSQARVLKGNAPTSAPALSK
jgi:WD40 repeat protein